MRDPVEWWHHSLRRGKTRLRFPLRQRQVGRSTCVRLSALISREENRLLNFLNQYFYGCRRLFWHPRNVFFFLSSSFLCILFLFDRYLQSRHPWISGKLVSCQFAKRDEPMCWQFITDSSSNNWIRGSLCSVVAKVLNCSLEICEFELQSRC